MKYDFTSILDRNGKDSIAVNPPMEAGWVNFAPVKEGFDLIPMWVADMNFPTVPTIPETITERVKHPAYDILNRGKNIMRGSFTGRRSETM